MTETGENFVAQCLARVEPLRYLAWQEKAAQLVNRGIRQTQCRHCQRWRFPNQHMKDDRCDHFEASGPQQRERQGR